MIQDFIVKFLGADLTCILCIFLAIYGAVCLFLKFLITMDEYDNRKY
jgi:hypothetical protein